jgi:serine protease AprX
MRYTLSSRTMSLDEIEAEAKKLGGKDIRRAPLTGFVFSELDPEQAAKLSLRGIELKPVKEYRTSQVMAAGPAAETLHEVFYQVRSYFHPPLSGTGLTVAVLDSGVRDTHVSLQGKVVYARNLTSSPTAKDVFGHGTQVAFLVCGGIHAEGAKAGVAPGARVINVKVISDEGKWTRGTP